MSARLFSAGTRIARVTRGDGRTLFVALLLFALMALIVAIFTRVVPAPFAESAPPASRSVLPRLDPSVQVQVGHAR